MAQKRRGGPPKGTATSTKTTTAKHHQDGYDHSSHGADAVVDLKLVGGVNADLWALIFGGRFRLAVQCDVCGRWLTSGKSKAAGVGPNCAARAVNR